MQGQRAQVQTCTNTLVGSTFQIELSERYHWASNTHNFLPSSPACLKVISMHQGAVTAVRYCRLRHLWRLTCECKVCSYKAAGADLG